MRRRGGFRTGLGGLVLAMAAMLGATPVAASTAVDTDTLALGQYLKGHACYGNCDSAARSPAVSSTAPDAATT